MGAMGMHSGADAVRALKPPIADLDARRRELQVADEKNRDFIDRNIT